MVNIRAGASAGRARPVGEAAVRHPDPAAREETRS
jgi:hypothetical protein